MQLTSRENLHFWTGIRNDPNNFNLREWKLHANFEVHQLYFQSHPRLWWLHLFYPVKFGKSVIYFVIFKIFNLTLLPQNRIFSAFRSAVIKSIECERYQKVFCGLDLHANGQSLMDDSGALLTIKVASEISDGAFSLCPRWGSDCTPLFISQKDSGHKTHLHLSGRRILDWKGMYINCFAMKYRDVKIFL